MLGLIGKKLGMTQVFTKDGRQIPVTVIKAGPCTVVQQKLVTTDGYDALQLGFEVTKATKLSKSRKMHCEKKNVPLFKKLKEFRTENAAKFSVGATLTLKGFKPGDIIDVIATSKGKGFQGVMKRHNKRGGPMSHGSNFHRRPGSIGQNTWPSRVFKNMKLPGHMGDECVTTKNLKVVDIRLDENVILIKGSVPGSNNGYVLIVNKAKDFENREDLIEQKSEKLKAESPKQEAKELKAESLKVKEEQEAKS